MTMKGAKTMTGNMTMMEQNSVKASPCKNVPIWHSVRLGFS